VDVGDLHELEGAFEGDGVVDAAAEEEEVVGGVKDFGELEALGVRGRTLEEQEKLETGSRSKLQNEILPRELLRPKFAQD
jgi:hypothetical protein